jgi:hypothetical protein
LLSAQARQGEASGLLGELVAVRRLMVCLLAAVALVILKQTQVVPVVRVEAAETSIQLAQQESAAKETLAVEVPRVLVAVVAVEARVLPVGTELLPLGRTAAEQAEQVKHRPSTEHLSPMQRAATAGGAEAPA